MKYDKILATRPKKTIYKDGDKIIKLFGEEYSKADILNEALNHARVEESGLNMPKVVEVTKIDGKWALILEFIEGKTLYNLNKEHPEKYEEYLNLFVDLQIAMHDKRIPLLTKLKDKMNRKISQADLSATTRYELHTRLESLSKQNCLCHGDFNPTNIVIKEDGAPYILDWSHATQGCPLADVARTYLIFHLYKEQDTAEDYINLYCKKTDTAKQLIQKWIPIVAASQSVKGKPEEREFLLNWIDVVDYS